MREIFLNKKTGFRIKDPSKPVIIRDFRGILFYSTEPLLPRIEYFNMPGLGKFFIESGTFTELSAPIVYTVKKLPNVECIRDSPFDFKILFAKNAHKATINFENKTIILDNSFIEAPLPKLYFIIYHEFAHQYFTTEDLTDALAANYMLVKGFNPEQIGDAQITSLSSRQYERKVSMVERLIDSTRENV